MKKIEFEEGSENIFEDLGVSQPEEKLLKAKLVMAINSIVDHRHLTQVEAAELLGLTQNKISDLHRGKLKGFSVEKLFVILNRLNRDIDIRIKRAPRSRVLGEVRLVGA
jgi:predicted XRE-type DNA-binding protein